MSLVDIKKVQDEAETEFRDEREKDAKKRIKSKMREIDNAKVVLRNLERELEDLMIAITEGN